ncbi:MAG: DUF1552 domain-containing protein [Planctomycetota bacterium]
MFGRRAFLQGAGVTFVLPWLEGIAARLPRELRTPPVRLAIVVTPNGMLPSAWHPQPQADGSGWVPSFTLESLALHRARVSVLTGLANRQSFDGDGHYAKVAPLLTGNKIRRTGGRDLSNGVSMDQVAAQQIGTHTLLPSLELGCDPIYPVEDMGYSTVYGGHIAWSAPDRPMQKEIVPRQVFDRLFRSRAMAADPTRASVLDAVRRDSKRLALRLGQRDRNKLDDYEDAVRALERRIDAAARRATTTPTIAADLAPPAGIPSDYRTHMGLMLDLIALAFRTDSTRIVTFLTGNEVSSRNFEFVDGCAGSFHEFSHHEGKAEKQEPYRRINRWHVEQFASLLDRLAAIEEGDGNLLDHSMVVLAAAMSDGNAHSPHDLPVLLAGSGGGSLAPGRLIASPKDTPLCSLWLALLQRLGVAAESFGDATKPLL